MIHNPFPNAFGLDIGDLSIKLVQLSNNSSKLHGPRYELKEIHSIHMPPGLIVDGELQKPEKVRHYLQKLLRGNGNRNKSIKSPWTVASLPEPQSFIKLITVHKKNEEVIDDDITLEAKKHIPFDEDSEYYLDWQILPNKKADENKTYILIGAIPRHTSDSYTYLLQSVGLGVIALEIEALALARSLVTASKDYTGEARALLDIGAARSSFVVYDNNSVRFSTSLPFSGELFATAISQQMNIDYEEAKEIMHKNGLTYSKDKKVWATVMKLTNLFIHEIKKAIQFYYTHFPENNRITHITMCGGGTNIKQLPELLSKELGIECQPGHPWKNLSNKKKINVPDQTSLTYSTAIGLAIRAADNPFSKIDII